MNVAMFYHRYLDGKGERQLIGGVETYLENLAQVCIELGWTPTLFQCAEQPFAKTVGALTVVGVPVMSAKPNRWHRLVYEAAAPRLDARRDLFIYGMESWALQTANPRSILIQHGVGWDVPWGTSHGWRKLIRWKSVDQLRKMLLDYRIASAFTRCANRVCVDYNYMNWYRAFFARDPGGRIWVIPNFARPATPEQIVARDRDCGPVRVLFARRFVKLRGTEIMAFAVRQALAAGTDVRFTFAGEGPEETHLRSLFSDESRVTFTRYLPAEALGVNLVHDVSVVPSLGSEGTSFAVAEAMGAGCAVVATAVGGVTNMILSGYNGILVLPKGPALAKGLSTVLADPVLRKRLGQVAYRTACEAFSLERWKVAWREVLLEVASL